jgi:UDP-N-acetylglucosamine 2-epimerase (non-hydrolysing)
VARKKIITIIGTRPEAIKLAPVIKELQRQHSLFEHLLVITAQHRQMLDFVSCGFGIALKTR